MKKKLLWLMPTWVLIICILYNYIADILHNNIEIFDYIIFILGICVILFIAPCFYIYLINKNNYNRIVFLKSIICTMLCISINAIIVNPNSILYYFNIRERGIHDLDFFPICIIIPGVIVIVGLCVIKIINAIKK